MKLSRLNDTFALALQVTTAVFGFVSQAIIPVTEDISQPPFVSIKGFVNLIGFLAILVLIALLRLIPKDNPKLSKGIPLGLTLALGLAGTLVANRYADFVLERTYFVATADGKKQTVFAPSAAEIPTQLYQDIAEGLQIPRDSITVEQVIEAQNRDPSSVWTVRQFWLARRHAGLLYGLSTMLLSAAVVSAIRLIAEDREEQE